MTGPTATTGPAGLLAAVLMASLLPVAASAGEAIFIQTATSEPRPVAAEAGPPAVVRVGRALDLEGRPVIFRAAVGPGASAVPSLNGLIAGRISSGFGMRQHPLTGGWRFHAGIDLAAAYGTPVKAPADGTVRSAGWAGGYGQLVVLRHAGGVETRYGHLSRLTVAAGESVRKGDLVGYVGSTGASTGPHLHFETRQNGRPIDPARR